jgi:hypothetical protein
MPSVLRRPASCRMRPLRGILPPRGPSFDRLRTSLGSTSLTTDENGGLIAEARYEPFGGERWSSGSLPTDFTYSGQRIEGQVRIDGLPRPVLRPPAGPIRQCGYDCAGLCESPRFEQVLVCAEFANDIFMIHLITVKDQRQRLMGMDI